MKSTFKATKKALAILLSLAFVFSAIFCMPVMAEDEVTTEPPVTEEPEEPAEQAPVYVMSKIHDSAIASTWAVVDNSNFTSATKVKAAVSSSLVLIYRETTKFTAQGVVDWLKDEDAQLRMWIKLPYRESAPTVKLGIDLHMEYYEKVTTTDETTGEVTSKNEIRYPKTTVYTNVVADGYWHEVRINATAFDNKIFDPALVEGNTYRNFSVRIRTSSANDAFAANEGICLSYVDFFDAPITAPVNDGNIKSEVVFTTLEKAKINSTNGESLTYEKTTVHDNRFIDYDEKIFAITAPAGNGYSGAYAFVTAKLTKDENHFNELYGWKNNNGILRFYIKNDGEEALTFQPYIYAYSALVDGTNDKYTQAIATNAITLPAKSGWVEVRIPANGFTNKGNFDFFGKGNASDCRIGLYTTAENGFLNTTGGTVYMSNPEFHNLPILEPVTTDFAREYTRVFTNGTYTHTSDTKTIKKTQNAACTDNPRFTKIHTFKTGEDYTAAASQRISVWGNSGAVSDDFANWLFNPDAELRFYAKSDRERTFTFYIQTSISGSYKDIKATVTIPATEGWQEIVIKRSAFNTNATMNSGVLSSSKCGIYVRWLTNAESFVANDSFSVSSQVEFFSDKSYLKGDINADGVENVKDIIRLKKIIAKGGNKTAVEIIRGDADSNSWISADDLVALRKILLNLV